MNLQPPPKRHRRRRFLKYALAASGIATAGSAWWIAKSNNRAARLIRQLIADARREILPAPVRPTPLAWSSNDITLCWIGHSTVLINFYGIHILTDPTLGNRIGVPVGPGTIGPKRYFAPALRRDELPPIDVVLLSHAHMDHLDLPSLSRFPPDTFTVTARATSDLLNGIGMKAITELKWGEQVTFHCARGDLRMEAFEVKHWGRRWPSGLDRGYNGYLLKREGKTVLFAGDTANTPLFGDLKSRGPFEVAIMPIGAYQPYIRNHCTPEQAVELATAAGARRILPVHHQTFQLSNEPINEPIERFQSALEKEADRIALRRVGETFVCPKV